ncbi:uncharacterized protein LOC131230757 [Magnolia sinica]|uniref:uncharacterized protein LOC131230757 n=1 Tax=Magnolia sinica TaxID=86752 RepID=UPI0026588EF6|nr:uncharacterized protein LOC131230757 [Magnolia sinica]
MANVNVSGAIFRPEFSICEHSYMEKRQLFLRSYQFSRKRSVMERIKLSLVRVKRLVWVKLRSARKLRRLVWSRLRYGHNRRRFHRLINRSNGGDWTFSSCC